MAESCVGEVLVANIMIRDIVIYVGDTFWISWVHAVVHREEMCGGYVFLILTNIVRLMMTGS
jgi:hypothetical protein